MSNKKFDKDKAFKNIVGVSDEVNLEKRNNLITDEMLVVNTPEKDETKSKKISLSLKPSVHDKTKKKCKKIGISVNEAINQLLENFILDI